MVGKVISLLGQAGSGKDTVAKLIGAHSSQVTTIAFATPLKEFARAVFEFPVENLWGASGLRNESFKSFGSISAWEEANFRMLKVAPKWAKRVLLTYDESPIHKRLLFALNEWFVSLARESIEAGGLTPRRALQTLGTECGRSVSQDVWANYGLKEASDEVLLRGRRAAIITDCRLLNEARLTKENGGEVWYVDRPSAGLGGEAGKHSSEQDIRSEEMRSYIDVHILNDGTLDELHDKVNLLARERLFGPGFEVGVEP